MSQEQLKALMDHGGEVGCVNLSAFTAVLQELDLPDDDIATLYE